MSILDEIFADKRVEVAQRQQLRPLAEVRRAAESAAPAKDFPGALLARNRQSGRPALIAEVKQASPSRGLLVQDFDPLRLAATYRDHGAAAISVLTDERYFKGHLDYLRQIAELEPRAARPPLLRKDFIYDPYQVYEARAAGADAVLLIAAHLEPRQLADLHRLALELGMAPLVEVHSRAELESVLPCAPRMVGVNNRDLRDFSVSLETTLQLRPFIPAGVVVVAESGIHTAGDIRRLAEQDVNAILVGEALVTAPDVAGKVREMAGEAAA